MAKEDVGGISLKALVDKEDNRVIFAEAKEDFVDVLLSFLTMPMGTIIRLLRSKPPILGIGCMNNLYNSVEDLDVQQFQTNACKIMLLYPRNAAAAECSRLKLKIDDDEPLRYFICSRYSCVLSGYKLLSHYRNAICHCGAIMDNEIKLNKKDGNAFDARDNGVFVKGWPRLIITDELKIMPASIEASLSLLSKLGIMDGTTTEECNVNLGVNEILTLLKCLLVSKTPLTETLLKHNPPELSKEDFDQGSYIKYRTEEPSSNVSGKISVKLTICKSKNMVCFAEASENFVDLLVSFLTVPFGCVVKDMYHGTSKGCITHLYNSVEELDIKQYLKSYEHKAMLQNPKVAPNFIYENYTLDIQEEKHPPYHYSVQSYPNPSVLTSDKTPFCNANTFSTSTLTVKDPKSHLKATGGGYFIGPANFTVTDNLIITPMSPISCLSLLHSLKVPYSDIEERVVHVGTEEALQLMVASFVSESALTNAFLREPNPKY